MPFNRTARLEFLTPDGTKSISGLGVKFRIELLMSSVLAMADISICNLSEDDLAFLTTYTSIAIALEQRKRIKLFVGYEGEAEKESLLIDGDIMQAYPSSLPPDVWLECQARSGGYKNLQTYKASVLSPAPLKTVVGAVANAMGLELVWKCSSQKTISQFSFTGNMNEALERINNLDDIFAFEEDGQLVVLDRNDPDRGNAIHFISKDTGMVGIPQLDFIGVVVKVLLNAKIKRGDTIRIESDRIPQANGDYRVWSLVHEGESRGQAWYTTITARRLDFYG